VLPSLTSMAPAITLARPLRVRRTRGTHCVVPRIRGRKLARAKRSLVRAHCAVGRVRAVRSKHVGRGRVISQTHRAGLSLPKNAKVGLLISGG
jgi:beta-lactam-binding protein with PASTA domain